MNHEQKQPGGRPNVLVILTDEWRAHNTGYAGDPHVRTPNIDRLAAEAVDFTQAVSGEPICCPARASFVTGQYPTEHGVYINDVPLEPEGTTVAEAFAQHGYRTGYIGKWHLHGSPDGRFERRNEYIPPEARLGFEHWAVLECTHDYNDSAYYLGDDPIRRRWEGYDAFDQTDAALDFMGSEGEDPFFLMLSYGPPHFPLQTAPERFRQMYAEERIALPDNVPTWAAERATEDLRGYYAHIAALDECVGRLLEGVDASNTVIAFTSDHGDMLWSQGIEHKLNPWEEAVRVPLLVKAPGRAAERTDQLFNSPDLMPTLLGFAGLPVPESVSGLDMSRRETSPATAFLSAPVAYSSMRRYGLDEYRGVRDARYTYVRTRRGPWLLYDNRADPAQLHNRCDDPALAEEQTRLDAELNAWLEKLGDEFAPGDEYLRRDGLEHYFEVNEPVGASGTDGWTSPDPRGRRYGVDTQIAAILANPAACAVVEELAPALLASDDALFPRRSLRLLAMADPERLPTALLGRLDARLARLGERSTAEGEGAALPAWPAPVRLTPAHTV
ncbi:sulfatase [Microbacterium sp. G2-8]|uniref:sulfatase family protein n=1 Tax=Microbacterium sp. G2-8 TaxID=2842454 RepID=UPI001C8ACE18|nr:sulfatase [Microbacterium sp. G2-8]